MLIRSSALENRLAKPDKKAYPYTKPSKSLTKQQANKKALKYQFGTVLGSPSNLTTQASFKTVFHYKWAKENASATAVVPTKKYESQRIHSRPATAAVKKSVVQKPVTPRLETQPPQLRVVKQSVTPTRLTADASPVPSAKPSEPKKLLRRNKSFASVTPRGGGNSSRDSMLMKPIQSTKHLMAQTISRATPVRSSMTRQSTSTGFNTKLTKMLGDIQALGHEKEALTD